MMTDFGVPTQEQLQKINKLAKRTLSADEIFVYPHKMAGDMIIPERYIQLTRDLLEQFVKNANAGVAFLLDHSWSGFFARPKAALPYGRVFEAELSQNGIIDGETISFNGTTYIVRGQEKDGISTNSIISDIETGVLFDTSIGWGANKFECSICGNDIRSWRNCEHIPGKLYIVNEETGETKLCYAMAKPPGYLMEDSGVFDGAYPGAGTSLSSVGNGGFENQTGTFSVFEDFKKIPENACVYGTYSNRGGILTFVKESDYNKVHSLGSIRGNSLKNALKGVESQMNENALKFIESLGLTYKEGETNLEELFSQVAKKWESTLSTIESAAEPITIYMTKEQATEKLGKELSSDDVLKLAKEGQEYHKQVIDDAVAMGIRAQGNDFPVETWKNTFANMSNQAIKDIMKTFENQANENIPFGRHTDPSSGQQKQSVDVPDEAYKVKK